MCNNRISVEECRRQIMCKFMSTERWELSMHRQWRWQRLMFDDLAVFDMNISTLKGFAWKTLFGEPLSPVPMNRLIGCIRATLFLRTENNNIECITFSVTTFACRTLIGTLLIRFSHAAMVHGSENRNCAKRTNYGGNGNRVSFLFISITVVHIRCLPTLTDSHTNAGTANGMTVNWENTKKI